LTFKAPLENINYAAAATAIFNSARDIPSDWAWLGERGAVQFLLCDGGVPTSGNAAVFAVSRAEGVLRGAGLAGAGLARRPYAGAIGSAVRDLRGERADGEAMDSLLA
jgi:hypothetical protein